MKHIINKIYDWNLSIVKEFAFSKELYIAYSEFKDIWVKILKKYPMDEVKVKTIFAKPSKINRKIYKNLIKNKYYKKNNS